MEKDFLVAEVGAEAEKAGKFFIFELLTIVRAGLFLLDVVGENFL